MTRSCINKNGQKGGAWNVNYDMQFSGKAKMISSMIA